jgi:ribosome-binding protein aMBF1 (putative translation factor)
MKVTTNHSTSSYGIPVILGDDGQVMDYAVGIKAIRRARGLSTTQLAAACNVSRRTVEGWEQGRMPLVSALNVMRDLVGE